MPVFKVEDVKDWSEEYKEEVCKWCWGHDYGNCDECVLCKHARRTPMKPPDTRRQKDEAEI